MGLPVECSLKPHELGDKMAGPAVEVRVRVKVRVRPTPLADA